MYSFLFSILCVILTLFDACIHQANAETYYLEPNQNIHYDPQAKPNSKRNDIFIYCYEGRPKYIIHIWQSVSLELVHKTNNFVYYTGQSPEEVEQEYEAHRSSWSLNIFTTKQKRFGLDPFNQSCIGIESRDSYTVFLHVIRIDYWKIIFLIAGLLLFISAPKLSENSLFYYISGVAFGICASFLILIYFASKIFPKRPMMYGFVLGGWTVGVYLIQLLWENFRLITTTYRTYLLWYTFITGLISFIICYRIGPVSNPRSKNLIRWTLQIFALLLIFNSSQFQEAAMGIIIIVLLGYNIPRSWVLKSKTYWKRKFPPKTRLLSNDEYYHQGVKETSKALTELRDYCSSPKCNQWKTVLRLENAKRFASFVEGNSHLSDQEVLDYEGESFHRTELTDDEDEDITNESNISSDEDL